MKTNLKDNIWIEGFDDRYECACMAYNGFPLLYEGKTSEIPEELAKECVSKMISNNPPLDQEIKFRGKYYNYSSISNYCKTATESIQSACNKEFCIIYKTN